MTEKTKKPSIERLEELMDQGVPIEILPTGEVKRLERHLEEPEIEEESKPVTLGENLGGEYTLAEYKVAYAMDYSLTVGTLVSS